MEFAERMKAIMEIKKKTYKFSLEPGKPQVECKVSKIRGKKVWVTTEGSENEIRLDGVASKKVLDDL